MPVLDDQIVCGKVCTQAAGDRVLCGKRENSRPSDRVFLKDGNVPVHNSSCEQAIIPFALGRNGWKSIDSIDGGITLGYYYSLTETAKANGAIPFYYLKFLL